MHPSGQSSEIKGPELESAAVVAQALVPYRKAWPSIWVTFQDAALMRHFELHRPEVTRVLHNPRFEPWITPEVRVYLAVERARTAGVSHLQLHRAELDAELVGQLSEKGLTLRASTVNDEEGLRLAATLGMERMTTDRLELAVQMHAAEGWARGEDSQNDATME